MILYSDVTGIYWMTAYLIPTLCTLFLSYAIFDSIAVAAAMRAGKEPPADPTMQAIWERVLVNRRRIGWVLVVARASSACSSCSRRRSTSCCASRLGLDVPLTALVLPMVLLIAGLRLVRRR